MFYKYLFQIFYILSIFGQNNTEIVKYVFKVYWDKHKICSAKKHFSKKKELEPEEKFKSVLFNELLLFWGLDQGWARSNFFKLFR